MNRNKKKITKAAAAGLCAAVTVNMAVPACAAAGSVIKDENIYATLDQDGSVSGVYVINEFTSEGGGQISDYGDYTSLQNLTDQSEIRMENGCIHADITKGKFYYQGNMESGELPWEISIAYYLDGEEIGAGELPGTSGDLKLVIRTKKNPAMDETFFENYLLQATVVLNTEKCSNIQADGATAGNVGVNRQLVYSIMPGEEKEIEITAMVENFEMEGIRFQGVPMSLGISGNMLDEIDLASQTRELTDAVSQLDDGVGELKKGTKAAADGDVQLADGVTELIQGISALHEGVSLLDANTGTLASGLSELNDGAGQLKEGTEEFRAQTDNIDEKIEEEMQKMLDEMSGSDFEPVSYTSDKNTNIGLVQFAATTDGIKILEVKKEPEPEKKKDLLTG